MARYGRSTLRDLFDDAPTPHIAHPPRTHRRDFYLATDGSFVDDGGGIGAIIETGGGERLARLARGDDSPDNNVAEYRALRVGLETLAERAGANARVGVLVDHNDLAANVNVTALGVSHPDWPAEVAGVPEAGGDHWQGIRGHIRGFDDLRAACVGSDRNPAHVLANAPEEYAHLEEAPGTGPRRHEGGEAPPPSRADRNASD
ncbi:MAG: ribonuclease H [Halobacteriales archaeon]